MMESMDQLAAVGATVFVVVLTVPICLAVLRMIVGPGFADRFIALDMLTALAVAVAALTSVSTGRREFLDVALGVALIGFVATCAIAAFLERKERER